MMYLNWHDFGKKNYIERGNFCGMKVFGYPYCQDTYEDVINAAQFGCSQRNPTSEV